MFEKIEQIHALLNVPNVNADSETAITNMKILNLLVKLRAEAEQLILCGVGSSLPTKEEIDIEANRQAEFINIFGEKRQSLSKYQGFMNCVNWYAEKIKK